MEPEVTCSVCSGQYASVTHEPVALPCGHTFCRDCLLKLQTFEGLACPACRALHHTSPGELPCIFSLLCISEKLTKDKATLPEMCHYHHEHLKGWCRSCEVSVCGICMADHRMVTHEIIPISVFVADKNQVLENKRIEIACVVDYLKASSESSVEDLVASLLTTFKNDREIVHVESELVWKRKSATQGLGIESMLAREHQHEDLRSLAMNLALTCGLARLHHGGGDDDSRAEEPIAWEVKMSSGSARPSRLEALPGMLGGCTAVWQPLRLCVVHEGRCARVTCEDRKILVSAFTNQFFAADFVIPWRYLVKMLPARPMAFLEASAGGRCLGKMFVNVVNSTRRVQQFLSLCLGTLGPSYAGTVLAMYDKNSFGDSADYFVIGGFYGGSDGAWSESLMGNLESSRGLCGRGVVATGNPSQADSVWFTVCTGKCDGMPIDGVVGEAVTDLDTIEKAVFNSVPGHVVVSRCGLVVPTP